MRRGSGMGILCSSPALLNCISLEGVSSHHPENHRIIEYYGLEVTFKIIESNYYPSSAKATTKPHPYMPHLHML